MKWGKVKVGDCCEVTSSKRIFFSEYVDSGVPFYRSKEIIESSNGQAISEPLFISQEKYDEIKNHFGVPQPGDMLLTSVGTIGVPYIVREKDYFYFKDGNLTWFRNFSDELNSKYLYFWVKSSEGQSVLNNTTIGSSQKALTIASLKGLEIPCPPAPVQKRIVEILAGFDDLIENNQKQIKLLEEEAQRLYKEWFVDLRFPSHETTPIIDGIPQGWEERNIDDVFSVQYGKMLPTSLLVPNGEYPVYGANGVIGYYTKANCFDYVTLITSRGNGSGDVLRTHHKASFVTNNSFVVLPKETYGHFELPFAYHLMKTLDFKSICTGSAQPQLTNKSISMLNVIVPTSAVVKAFCNIANPMLAKIELL